MALGGCDNLSAGAYYVASRYEREEFVLLARVWHRISAFHRVVHGKKTWTRAKCTMYKTKKHMVHLQRVHKQINKHKEPANPQRRPRKRTKLPCDAKTSTFPPRRPKHDQEALEDPKRDLAWPKVPPTWSSIRIKVRHRPLSIYSETHLWNKRSTCRWPSCSSFSATSHGPNRELDAASN